MSKTPLFSTYRAGENRVTGSLLAVFERIGLDLVERILGGVVGESSLQLVNFANQPGKGGKGVPDAVMSSDFRYLFEVKTVEGAIAGPSATEQLRRHLDRLDGSHGDERLFVLTPDFAEPTEIAKLADPRVSWISFEGLAQVINQILDDPAEPAGERDRYLLRELLYLFEADGLLGSEDTVIVAAGFAYGEYLQHSAYVCQANRPFRPRVARMGFYTQKEIKPEIPAILSRHDNVLFTLDEAERLEPTAPEVGALVRAMVRAGSRTDETLSVFLLSAADDPQTLRLSGPVVHEGRGAWVQWQRYVRSDRLSLTNTTKKL